MSRPLAALLLALAIASGAAARHRGDDFLLPRTALDGSIIVHQVQEIRTHPPAERGGLRWRFYPLLFAHCVALLPDPLAPGTPGAPGTQSAAEPEALEASEHWERAGAQWLQARRVSAALSLLLVLATYSLARRFLSRAAALLAATLVVTSLVHARFGTMVRPHGLASSLTAFTLVAALHARRRGPGWLVLGGALAGLSIGTLHYGVFALPPLVVAAALHRRGWRGAAGLRSLLGLLGAALVVLLCVRWLYPFHFEGRSGFLSLQRDAQQGAALNLSGQPLKLSRFNGSGFARVAGYLWSYEPLLLVLAPCGLALLVWRWLRGARPSSDRARDLLVVLSHALPYGLVIGLYAETWERFLIQLLPVLCMAAALAVEALGRRHAWSGRVLVALALAFPAAGLVRLGQVRAAPTTWEEAGEWMQGAVRPDTERALLTTYDDLPLLYTRAALRENRPQNWGSWWVRYQSSLTEKRFSGPRYAVLLPAGEPAAVERAYLERPLELLRERRPTWVVVPDEPAWRAAGGAALRNVRDALRAHGSAALRVSPAANGGPAHLAYQASQDLAWSRPFWLELWRDRCLGPALEVHRLPR